MCSLRAKFLSMCSTMACVEGGSAPTVSPGQTSSYLAGWSPLACRERALVGSYQTLATAIGDELIALRSQTHGSTGVEYHSPARSGSRPAPRAATDRDRRCPSASRRWPRSRPACRACRPAPRPPPPRRRPPPRHRVGRPLGLVVQLDRARDLGLDAGGLARSSGPSAPAARGTRRPSPTPDRPWPAAPRAAHPPAPRPPSRRSGRPAPRRARPAPSGSQLLVEGDAGERRRHLVERLLEVLLPEELGVREPRARSPSRCRRRSARRRPSRSGSTPAGTGWRACPSAGASSEKHFWCCFMEGIRHSAGTARNASSKWPIRTVGHSVSPAFSASSASSSTSASLCLAASARACSAISAARSLASRITLWVLSPFV